MEREHIRALLVLNNNDHYGDDSNISPGHQWFRLRAQSAHIQSNAKPGAQCKAVLDKYDAFMRRDGRPDGTGA